MTSVDGLKVERNGPVTWVRLDRPDRLNALSTSLQRRIVETFTELDSDAETCVVVLGTTSARAFCAGADLKENGADRWVDPMRTPQRNVYEAVFECRKPTLAALRGWVVGGGMELAMACDMRIAAEDTRFRMPEGRVGLGANFGSQMLPRLVPWAHAFDILYRAETFDATRAERIGLVSQVVAAEEMEPHVQAVAETIASRAPLSLRRFKAMVQHGSTLPVATAVRLDPGPSPYLSRDRAEGAEAFSEKRAPVWSGQ
ncbi:enoyl-CoA hydratase/carnithine racemase [Nocardioides salarius]|uniref:Enoyl-CoA hydratase/carnithine racemase n=1 Tax=Nocardioides salarius TaxID=374513 RepID=A0ABS2MA50_9ACTN|nr:enoyl-CoA hydratase/isomerase family protein [Nocardioides salarius]MBM7508072.1 enoyl-CoA hydratase/carnithine racemase [Nocardioides salarius]